MIDRLGGSTSAWMASAGMPHFLPLQERIEAEVCVIGGGLAGLSTAYLLAQEGRDVVLIEAGELGSGETGRTTAHFFPPDERYFEIERAFGTAAARLVAESYRAAIEQVQTIVRSEHIDCRFERLDGYLVVPNPDGYPVLDKELAAARRAGVDLSKVVKVPGLPFDSGPALRFDGQAQFHPLRYLQGLARAIVARGSRIYTNTRALHINGDGARRTVLAECGQISAGAVVVATNTPFNNRVVMHTKQAAYRTYVIGIEVPRASVPRVLLWDTADPYHYVRLETPDPDSGQDLLIVGGADHKVGQDEHPEHRYAELEAWTRARYPMAGAVRHRWSGEVMEPADGLAYAGRNPMDDRNVYIITGDSGNGMTHCTAGAMLVTDLIAGRDNPWVAVYDPSRKVTHGVSEFIREQANTLSQYRDWFTEGEAESVHEIAPGQGAILREGARKIAVYRDDDGWLHAVSAKCTHLGCVVAFNSAEKSWDCPCHGSRFDLNGQVLHGPAMHALEPVSLNNQADLPIKSERPDSRPEAR
jgi:glycine/D-amino acid oxidase-like deaminating enzyme/nitrite reductase/ring-hydroxylating ferredoxin subunit